MSIVETFHEEHVSIDSYWRSIILFGKNVASYKFALAMSLLQFAKNGKTEVSLEDLSIPFSESLCNHIMNAPKQSTSRTSSFLETCKNYNLGHVSHEFLIETTVKKGFNNVIDAFHVVNNGVLPKKFYDKAYSPMNKKIILTDALFQL